MFGGSSKLGRGGGRGGGGRGGAPRNRSSFPPLTHRSPAAVGRMCTGGGSSSVLRQRSTTSVKPASSASCAAPRAVEETFSLVPGKKPPAFAMIIRLAPDMVEEIRGLEEQGRNAKIKFDAFSNNTSGNIIDVGGKEFKFTWSRELGDLCDIYEECQSGEDGNGVLVEAGCAWRKLNVQRTLDESTTNHVKMRSVEAEQRTKSRKAIVLDPGNPSVTKQLARAESSPWRKYNHQKKEPPPKKRKVDPPQVPIGGSKPAFKPGLASTTAVKGRLSASPGPSPPDQFNCSPSIGMGNLVKSHATNEDVAPVQTKSKESIVGTQKDPPTWADNTLSDTSGHKANNVDKPSDLQSLLINLLKDAPMSLKALEKAVRDRIPNASKSIEPILKKIANFQAPGRYSLKPGVEFESFKNHSPESGSSPEGNHQLLPIAEHTHDQVPMPGPKSMENISVCEPSGKDQQDCIAVHPGGQTNVPENVDNEQQSSDVRGEENREGQACSSSDTGSDSDSDSDNSDSGSDSGSHSKSRAGSESGSSSDSEASSNSKEGSDAEVDIMSDDDREPRHHMPPSTELGLPTSALPCQTDGNRTAHDESLEKQEGDGVNPIDVDGHGSYADDVVGHDSDAIDGDGHGSDAVDIQGHRSGECHRFQTEKTMDTSHVANNEGNLGQEHFSSDHDELQERQNFIGMLFDDTDNIGKDSFSNEQSDSSERLARGKSKRASDLEHFNQKPEHAKRTKADGFSQSPSLGKDSQPFENMHELSPNKCEGPDKAPLSQMTGPANREFDANLDPNTGPNKALTGNSNSDFQPSSCRVPQSTPTKPIDGSGRPRKQTDASGNVRISAERDLYPHEILPSRTAKKTFRDKRRDENKVKEKKLPRNKRDGNTASKHALLSDALNRKHDELAGNAKEAQNVSGFSLGSSSPMDNQRTSSDNLAKGNGSMLQREVSDLELGELREPLAEDTAVKQLEEKSSYKQQDNKTSTSENRDLGLDKRKPFRKSNIDSKRPAPPNASNGIKGLPEHSVEDLAGSHNWVLQSHVQHHSGADNAEIGLQHSKLEEENGKSRQNDFGSRLGSVVEGYGETQKKPSIVAPKQHNTKRGSVSQSMKESKRNTSIEVGNLINTQKDRVLTLSESAIRKKSEISFDEEESSYLKYEKASPELKGPINDLSQYKAYMQEYLDKYDVYCSLHKILESYRNEFQNLGEDLEFARGRDMGRYNKILQKLKESYHKSGERHKRLKKIFILLHEELKNRKQRMKEYASSQGKD